MDNLLAMTVHTGATPASYYYYIKDHLGTVHALVDAEGTVVESYRYDAWGRLLEVEGGGSQRSVVCSPWSSACPSVASGEGGYDPVTARWLSTDPIGISGGLNQYVFCSDNVPNLSDAYGLFSWGGIWRGGILGIVAGFVVNQCRLDYTIGGDTLYGITYPALIPGSARTRLTQFGRNFSCLTPAGQALIESHELLQRGHDPHFLIRF